MRVLLIALLCLCGLVLAACAPASPATTPVATSPPRGAAHDLTQPRCDAFGSLSADGTMVLLLNGRGGLWATPFEVR